MNAKTRVLFAVVSTMAAGMPTSGWTQQKSKGTFEVTSACSKNSRAPEVYTFYGDPKVVLEKAGKFDISLAGRRMYGILLETEDTSELALYEKTEDGKVTVTDYSGNRVENLKTEIEKAILDSKGECCVGAEAKAVVFKIIKPLSEKKGLPIPASMKAVVSGFTKKHEDKGKFVRLTVYLLC